MSYELTLAAVGLLLSVPSAFVHLRDLRAAPSVEAHWPPPSERGPAPSAPPTVFGPPVARQRVAPLSLPRRFLASVVDFYAVLLVGFFVSGVLFGVQEGSEDLTGGDVVGLGLAWLALVVWSSRTGRSPGRLLAGGRLVPIDDPDGRVSLAVVAIRSLIGGASNLVFFLALWVGLADRSRRGLHDRMTDTMVVRTR